MTQQQLLDLLQQMTLEEKIGQMSQCNTMLLTDTAFDPVGPATKRNLTPEQVATIGSSLNFACCADGMAAQNKQMAAHRLHIPMLLMMDVIHGYRTSFPVPLGMAASFDPDLMEECTRMAAREAYASGVHVTFTPMIDLSRDPRWGRCVEGAGEDPLLASRMGAAQVRGFQGDGLDKPNTLAACVKHFAAYGAGDGGKDYNVVELSEGVLREYYLPAYKACVDAGVMLLMPSFNSLNGIPSTVNSWLMQDILRKEWGFDGMVITDYNSLEELLSHGITDNLKDSALLGIENGTDIEMVSNAYMKHLPELVAEGKVSLEAIDKACLKVLELKNALGLFEDPYRGATPETEAAACLTPEHRAIALRAAEESAILLKNDGLLPLKEVKRVALIGPFADNNAMQGKWACHGQNEDNIPVFEALRAQYPKMKIDLVKGCGNAWDDTDQSGIPAAVKAAKKADTVILCLGEPQEYSGEGNCRTEITLPGPQVALARAVLAANPKTAVVLFNGRPLAIPELDEMAPAILEMWYPGCEGGTAAVNLLFGKANPCSKVPMSFPRTVGQVPIYYNHPNTGRPKPNDKKWYGYCSCYIDSPNSPLYAFGHGLSYSTFRYDSLLLDKTSMKKDGSIAVAVVLTNTSSIKGKEVVQLYMHDKTASTVRPVCQLIDFKKVTLEPGETTTVTFTVTEPQLRIWSKNKKWESEPGTFTLFTGKSDNLLFPTDFTLE
jgi:beta-glucosidase